MHWNQKEKEMTGKTTKDENRSTKLQLRRHVNFWVNDVEGEPYRRMQITYIAIPQPPIPDMLRCNKAICPVGESPFTF
jgi:hypothetical protein